jgi:hypothetical protein
MVEVRIHYRRKLQGINEITKDVRNKMNAHGSSRNKGGQGHVNLNVYKQTLGYKDKSMQYPKDAGIPKQGNKKAKG